MNFEQLNLVYVKELQGAKVLIKIGGHAMTDESALDETIKDVVFLHKIGVRPIVVHGGGPEISEIMEKFGIVPKFVEGLRVTDEATMEIVDMVLGKINSKMVSKFIKYGGKAVGISGKDGSLIVAKKKIMKIKKDCEEINLDLGYVGETEKVNSRILEILIDNDFIPVVSPVSADLDGKSYNLNADTVAGDIAAAMKVKRLVMVTDVPGLLRDPRDKRSLVRKVKVDELKSYEISGGMKPKIEAVVKALKGGVEKAHIIGASKRAIILELFTDEGVGTVVEL